VMREETQAGIVRAVVKFLVLNWKAKWTDVMISFATPHNEWAIEILFRLSVHVTASKPGVNWMPSLSGLVTDAWGAETLLDVLSVCREKSFQTFASPITARLNEPVWSVVMKYQRSNVTAREVHCGKKKKNACDWFYLSYALLGEFIMYRT
jgi:hypothetical protein